MKVKSESEVAQSCPTRLLRPWDFPGKSTGVGCHCLLQYWHKNRQIDQWNRIKSPEVDPHKYSQLISPTRAKARQWSKVSLFNKWCWNNWTSTNKTMTLVTDLTLFTKINSRWITDLNVKCKTIKPLEGNTGENPHDLGYGDITTEA